jgi:hypothetical protein
MTMNQKKLLTAVLVPIELVMAVLAWRDLAGRQEAQVRGKKNLWRAFISINPGNAVIYWLVGRR